MRFRFPAAVLAAVLLAAAAVAPAVAQVPPAELGQRYIPAPWWLRDPVIAATGQVRTEVPANRASFAARFATVEKTAADATNAAAAKARALDAALRALGADRVRVETGFATRPIYDQYRQKDGTLVDNERPDRIDAYEATARLSVEVRDMALLERAYRLVVAARPTGIDRVDYALEPSNELKTWLAGAAIGDAAKRARQAVQQAGARLGAPRVIDPSGGVCQTQVLAGWPSYVGQALPSDVEPPQEITVTAQRVAAPPPPPPPPAPGASLEARADAVQVTLQPPLRELVDSACVIYGLLPPG